MYLTEEDIKEAVYKCLRKIIREGMDYDEDDYWYWVITSKTSQRKDNWGRTLYHKHYILNAAYGTSNLDAERIIYGTLEDGWKIECSLDCKIEDIEWLYNRWEEGGGKIESEVYIKNIKEINDSEKWQTFEPEKLSPKKIANLFGLE